MTGHFITWYRLLGIDACDDNLLPQNLNSCNYNGCPLAVCKLKYPPTGWAYIMLLLFYFCFICLYWLVSSKCNGFTLHFCMNIWCLNFSVLHGNIYIQCIQFQVTSTYIYNILSNTGHTSDITERIHACPQQPEVCNDVTANSRPHALWVRNGLSCFFFCVLHDNV